MFRRSMRLNMREKTLMRKVRSVLTDDLLKPEYLNKENRRPYEGHCYVASESLYWLLGGLDSGYKPRVVKHEGTTHWFLQRPDGSILDPTAEQFETPVPYKDSRILPFLTRQPSKRAAEVLNRVKSRRSMAIKYLG